MDGWSVGRIDRNSRLWCRECIIEIEKNDAPCVFVCSGQICVEGLDILTAYCMRNIFECEGELTTEKLTSSIEVINSCFTDITTEDVFISLGRIERETITRCAFNKITRSPLVNRQDERKKQSSIHQRNHADEVCESILSAIQMIECEEGVYGGIVSGLTDRTEHSFECLNSSFIRCFRGRNASPNDGNCSSANIVNCTYGNSSSSAQHGLTLDATKEYRFVDCTFNNTYSQNQHGGAIYMSGTSSSYGKSLQITRSPFNQCEGKAT